MHCVCRELGMPENHAPTLRHYLLQDFAYSYRVWITLIKLPYALLRYHLSGPNIHQGEKLCARLLPSVLRVSEKNSSRDCLKNSLTRPLECQSTVTHPENEVNKARFSYSGSPLGLPLEIFQTVSLGSSLNKLFLAPWYR